ncbi:MAG: helix-turn-helix transcriptional regulator [Acidobacteriia bacterium]|nr:helix-turn-helix transcriptional regulator [Terriglobia bacterium]
MRAIPFLFFFAIAGVGCISVAKSYGLQRRYRQEYLPAYTLYLGGWGVLALFAVVHFILATPVIPAEAWVRITLALNPLVHLIVAVSMYFYSSLMAQLAGRKLSRLYNILYAVAWGGSAVVIAIVAARPPAEISNYPLVLSVAQYLLRTVTFLGWGLYLLLHLRKIDDLLERRFLRNWVILLLAGYASFDLSLKIPRASDYVIATLQAGFNIPALFYLSYFLRRRSVERPFEANQTDLNAILVPLGVSPRETEIVELILRGFSNKEISGRLFISVDTVKKHSYNVYRKLGVQNRVQLSYFVQNRPGGPQRG